MHNALRRLHQPGTISECVYLFSHLSSPAYSTEFALAHIRTHVCTCTNTFRCVRFGRTPSVLLEHYTFAIYILQSAIHRSPGHLNFWTDLGIGAVLSHCKWFYSRLKTVDLKCRINEATPNTMLYSNCVVVFDNLLLILREFQYALIESIRP